MNEPTTYRLTDDEVADKTIELSEQLDLLREARTELYDLQERQAKLKEHIAETKAGKDLAKVTKDAKVKKEAVDHFTYAVETLAREVTTRCTETPQKGLPLDDGDNERPSAADRTMPLPGVDQAVRGLRDSLERTGTTLTIEAGGKSVTLGAKA